jgi:putative transcriptional regulator
MDFGVLKSAPEKIQNQICRLRFEHGELTQQQLADLVRCTRQTVISLEKGKYLPTLALAIRIARVFNVPVEKVFELEG